MPTAIPAARFYTSWRDGKRTGAKKLQRLNSFVKFCLKRKWLADDMLSVYTGLRISDVSMFNIADRLKGNDVFSGCTKPRSSSLPGYRTGWLVRLRTREKKQGRLYSVLGKP